MKPVAIYHDRPCRCGKHEPLYFFDGTCGCIDCAMKALNTEIRPRLCTICRGHGKMYTARCQGWVKLSNKPEPQFFEVYEAVCEDCIRQAGLEGTKYEYGSKRSGS